jgi:hypothetical protein
MFLMGILERPLVKNPLRVKKPEMERGFLRAGGAQEPLLRIVSENQKPQVTITFK